MEVFIVFLLIETLPKGLIILDGDGLDDMHAIVRGDHDDAKEGGDGGDGDHHHPPDEHPVSGKPRLVCHHLLLGHLLLALNNEYYNS